MASRSPIFKIAETEQSRQQQKREALNFMLQHPISSARRPNRKKNASRNWRKAFLIIKSMNCIQIVREEEGVMQGREHRYLSSPIYMTESWPISSTRGRSFLYYDSVVGSSSEVVEVPYLSLREVNRGFQRLPIYRVS